MELGNRIVVLIDMDCFYCQVEEKLNPELKGKPIAVVQYNPWKGGGIIAVNYVARAMGVTRHMRGDEAKEKCPDIQIPSVPCLRGKADTTKYRDAGKEVAIVLQRFTPLLERASVDEAYLDITDAVKQRINTLPVNCITSEILPNTYILGYESLGNYLDDVQGFSNENIEFDAEHARELLVGAVIVSEIRDAVYLETGYQCSAGIAHNKILAKLVCGMNKPNKQTVLPKHCINILYRTLPVKKVKNLGGKFGESVCDLLKISKMYELQTFTEKQLQTKFDDKNGSWLYNIARGIDQEPVQAKFNSKSIGCCKQFRGKNALTDLVNLKKWLKDLGDEIDDRLEKDAIENNRTPRQMVVSFAIQVNDSKDVSSSRSYNFTNDDEICSELFYSKALELIMENIGQGNFKDTEDNKIIGAPIKFLGISVGKFEDNSDNKKTKKIRDYFTAGTSKDNINNNNSKIKLKNDEGLSSKKHDKNYIMKKFFQVNDENIEENKETELKVKSEPITTETFTDNGIKSVNKTSLEVNLDQQESFFVKFLKQSLTKSPVKIHQEPTNTNSNLEVLNLDSIENVNSNDSNYSGSTINEEINKSILLFDDDPADIARVSKMRNLLGQSVLLNQENSNSITVSEGNCVPKEPDNIPSPIIDSISCPQCGKTVALTELEIHTDYHLAIQLRNEERESVRKEINERNIKKENIKNSSTCTENNKTINSMKNFVTTFAENIPKESCSECGKKIPIDKLGEHSDFHEAQRVSRELNQKNTFMVNNVKRKRTNLSPVKNSKVPCKTIDSFFR